jgi:FOG: Ankyrin repeat
VVARLLQAGLDVNIRTASGTALHEAALCGKLEVVKTLLEHGADLRIIDSKHNTVLDLLKQFPPHAVHDISTIINREWFYFLHFSRIFLSQFSAGNGGDPKSQSMVQ